MDSPGGRSSASPAATPDILSPGGKSRYGRTRRPKISRDFYNIDDVVIDENPAPRLSPLKSPKLKPPPKSPIIREVVFEIKDEFNKLDDLGMKVANNFKTNLQRGLDDTIKERKFFKTMPECKLEVPNVDVTKVFKLISSNPVVSESKPVKTALKTYSNKRKHVHDSDSFVVESFGLPDEPIIPVNNPLAVERDTKIDMDMTCKVDVNLQNPWSFDDFEPLPLYASEPVGTMDHNLTRGAVLDLFNCDSLLSEDTEIERVFECQDTNFEKSKIPTPEVPQEKKSQSSERIDFEKSKIPAEIPQKKKSEKIDEKNNKKKILRNAIEAEKTNKNAEKSTVGKHVTKDVAKIAKTNFEEAQDVKIKKVEAKVLNKKFPLRSTVGCNDKDVAKDVGKIAKTNSEVAQDVKIKKVEAKVLNKKTPLKSTVGCNDKDVAKDVAKIAKTNSEVAQDVKIKKVADKKSPLKSTVGCNDKDVVKDVAKFTKTNSEVAQDVKIKKVEAKVLNKKTPLKSTVGCNDKDVAKDVGKIAKTNSEVAQDVKIKKFADKKSPLKKKAKLENAPRILRSSIDNNNVEIKKDSVEKPEPNKNQKSQLKPLCSSEIPTLPKRNKNQVINPAKLAKNICSPQVRVILNPLSYTHKLLEQKRLVLNPFKVKSEKSKSSIKNKIKFKSPESKERIRKSKKARKRGRLRKYRIKAEELDIKNIKIVTIEFHVGDLTWAKIGTHPYWPCMITQEPISGDHKKIVMNRAQPLYHVRFFGDKGRRSWVSAQHIMLFNARDDLEKAAKVLKAEDQFKASYIKESYVVRESKLAKWQEGVGEAESLKSKTVEERLNYFFEAFATKREKRQKMRELGIKEELIEESETDESPMKTRKRYRLTEGDNFPKKLKNDFEEPKLGDVIKKETPDEHLQEFSEVLKKEERDLEELVKKNVRKSRMESQSQNSPVKKAKKDEETVQEKKNGKKGQSKEDSVEMTSPRLRVRKSQTDEKIEIPEGRKNTREKSQSNEETIEEERKLTRKKCQSNEDHIEILASPEDRRRLTRNRSQSNEEIIEKSEEKTGPPVRKKIERKTHSSEEEESRKKKNEESSDEDLPLSSVRKTRSQEAQKDVPQKPSEETNGRKKFVKEEEFSEESLEARKKLRNFPSKPEPIESVQDLKKTKRNSTEEEPEEGEPKLKNKRHQIPGEYSNSDTDSKFSDNSSVPTSLESQAALYRRNNIFRGIPKEKVCQVCEEVGEVFKCKGPCNGVYHINCAMIQIKEEQSEEKEEKESQDQVEIIAVNSKKPLPNLSESPNYKGMTLAEKIDFRMKEIMKKFDYQTMYSESTDSSSEELVMDESFETIKSPSKLSLTITNKPSKKEVPIIKHVTADNISYICVTNEKPKEKETTELIKDNLKQFKCSWCSTDETPRCLVCNKEESKAGSKFRQKCSLHQCGKYYHPECLKMWPQTQWSLIQTAKDKKSDAFVCPRHVCHTCISDDPRAANPRCPSDKVVKCVRCPATYHSSNYCVPAGSHILSTSQIVCPRHFNKQTSKKRMQLTINTNWCFICSKGGNLICCETCPTSVHVECLPGDLNEDDTFFCEDCQSGRLPLYDEIVWVKLGTFRWWPALILFPNEIPDNVKNIAHNKGEFVVKFFGTYDHYWVGRGRTFLFQEGDKGHSNSARKRVDNAFVKAIEEAAAAHQLKKQFKLSKVAEKNSGLKPPPYIRIKVNKPVGNVRLFDGNTSNTTSCECDPNQPHPCGPDSDCLNRLLLTECNPEVCPAGERCNNQCFEKREYPPLVPHRTQVRGWGLKTLAPIRKGQFVIEYVGEIIDEQEYQRRVQKMHEQKEENYYFLTIDKDRTLDAGPKGNVARFMNHSCQPNCETQKWTVNGDTRVGLFANCDIPADAELTFNYNLECIGKEKKMCKCGAPNCSGFIGVKVKQDGPSKKSSKPKKKKTPPPEVVDNENPCFICGKVGDVAACNNKICTKYYHLGCVGLPVWPEGGKFVCQWHNCNMCSKRTIRCCVKCVNSYCPPHSDGNVRYDKLLGFVCFEHDPTKEALPIENSNASVSTEEEAVTSTTPEDDADDPDDLDSMSLSQRLTGCVTSTPLKKMNESSQDESTVSSASTTEVKKKIARRKKGKRKSKKRVQEVRNAAKSHVKNTANLFSSLQKEVKLSKFTPVAYLRTSRSSTKLNRTDPEKDLPIRKRTRLRCGNTL